MTKLAVDTNVLARALVSDGSAQAAASQQLFRDHEVFVSESVLLETEWVLRGMFGLNRMAINHLFVALVEAADVSFMDRAKLLRVISAHRGGMDFADALHLFNAKDCDAMISFDRQFSKRAATLTGVVPVKSLS